MYNKIIAAGVLGWALSSTGLAQAGIVAQHFSDADPTTQGWTAHPNTGGEVDVFPIDDNGTLSWVVNDKSNADGSTYIYDQAIAADDIALGNSNGWELHANMRSLWSQDHVDGTLFVGYRDGATAWQMNLSFDTDTNSNTVVKLFTDISGPVLGPSIVVPGNDYHDYSLVYDPVSHTADFLVDGIVMISDYTGYASTDKLVAFGAESGPYAGLGKFHSVLLNMNDRLIPEPNSLALAVVGGIGLFWFGQKRTRRAA